MPALFIFDTAFSFVRTQFRKSVVTLPVSIKIRLSMFPGGSALPSQSGIDLEKVLNLTVPRWGKNCKNNLLRVFWIFF